MADLHLKKGKKSFFPCFSSRLGCSFELVVVITCTYLYVENAVSRVDHHRWPTLVRSQMMWEMTVNCFHECVICFIIESFLYV